MAQDHSKKGIEQNIEGVETKHNSVSDSVIEFDLMIYMHLLEDIDADEASKLELLQTLHAILKSFMSLGIRIEMGDSICGKETNSASKTSVELQNHIYSTHQSLKDKTQLTAHTLDDVAKKGVEA